MSLFDEIVRASGIPPLLAEPSITRALQSIGLDPATVTKSDVLKAIPEIEKKVRLYLPSEEATARISEIRAIVSG